MNISTKLNMITFWYAINYRKFFFIFCPNFFVILTKILCGQIDKNVYNKTLTPWLNMTKMLSILYIPHQIYFF